MYRHTKLALALMAALIGVLTVSCLEVAEWRYSPVVTLDSHSFLLSSLMGATTPGIQELREIPETARPNGRTIVRIVGALCEGRLDIVDSTTIAATVYNRSHDLSKVCFLLSTRALPSDHLTFEDDRDLLTPSIRVQETKWSDSANITLASVTDRANVVLLNIQWIAPDTTKYGFPGRAQTLVFLVGSSGASIYTVSGRQVAVRVDWTGRAWSPLYYFDTPQNANGFLTITSIREPESQH